MSEIQMKKGKIRSITLIGTEKRTSNSYGRNLPYMSYRVLLNKVSEEGESYVVEISTVFTKEELKELAYWSNRSLSMAMTCWGTSQQFEAQIALGRFMGFSEKNWPDFSRKCGEFIKII